MDYDYYIGQDEWFDANWTAKVTPQFAEWWRGHYGLPGDYGKPDPYPFAPRPSDSEHHEYFLRMAFALQGWLAAKERG